MHDILDITNNRFYCTVRYFYRKRSRNNSWNDFYTLIRPFSDYNIFIDWFIFEWKRYYIIKSGYNYYKHYYFYNLWHNTYYWTICFWILSLFIYEKYKCFSNDPTFSGIYGLLIASIFIYKNLTNRINKKKNNGEELIDFTDNKDNKDDIGANEEG